MPCATPVDLAGAAVVRTLDSVEGAVPGDNPDGGIATPSELNRTSIVRFSLDREVEPHQRVVLVLVPGFLAGAAFNEVLGPALVRRATEHGLALEVWSVDRRSNALEDHRGLHTGDPEVASAYYREGAEVDGATFAGFKDPPTELKFMSEWGLRTHVEDVRALVQRAHEQAAHVFLGGHSLGASFVEAYAAWRFEDGTRAPAELSGVIVLDGVLGDEPITEAQYLDGWPGGLGPNPGLNAVRSGQVVTSLPLFGLEVYATLAIQAMRAVADPTGTSVDEKRDALLSILLSTSLDDLPTLTNRAYIGLVLDEAHTPLAFLATALGTLTGGPIEEFQPLFGEPKLRPSDPDGSYDWIDGPDADPAEPTRVQDVARAASMAGNDLTEWYFPTRLSLDLAAVGGAAVDEDGWQASYGLRAFDGPLMDRPVLSIQGGLALDRMAAMEERVGTSDFTTIDAQHLEHVDIVLAHDGPANPVPAAIADFVVRIVGESACVP